MLGPQLWQYDTLWLWVPAFAGTTTVFADAMPACTSARRQHGFNLAVEAREGHAQFPDVAFRRPRLDPKIRLRLAGDEVDFAAVRLHVVDYDVPVFSPPFGAVVDFFSAEKGCRIGRPI